METINGIIYRINYYNKDNGYTVAILELDQKSINISMKKAKTVGSTVTIVGNFDREPTIKEEYNLEGEFVRTQNYGTQFKVSKYTRKLIKNKEGIISYLSSSLFPGIGPKIADVIIQNLGIDCLRKIKKDSSVLNKIGLSTKQIEVITTGLSSDEQNEENVIFFLDNGITMDMAHKIISIFGEKAKEIVLANPYILMERIDHFGFKKNDAFALKLGIEENSPIRLKALLIHILQEALYSCGNSYITKSELYTYIVKELGKEIDNETYQNILQDSARDKKIYIHENEYIFDYKMYIQEIELALELSKILKDTRSNTKKPAKYTEEQIQVEYEKIKNNSNITFSDEQVEAILSAFTEPIVIITGGPGTGKTTIVKAIIEMYLKLNNDNKLIADYIALLAPTGKAAKRLKEATNMNAMTIHKFLGYMGNNNFTYNKFNKTEAKLIIIDEASMMDLPLASQLITSMQPDSRIIIVGDVHQLPSVGPGQVLKDLIDSKEIKTIKLTKIHRQAEDSNIIKIAHNINEGILPDNLLEKLKDRTFIPTDNEYIAKMLVDIVKKYVDRGYDIKKDIQILAPMYKGDSGINILNARIQDTINPKTDDIDEVKHYGSVFRVNDKVIQLVNRAEKGIMNGDVGYISHFNYHDNKVKSIEVVYDTVKVEYTIEELEDISLAYAISVHKSQGGEFDIVIIPFDSRHFIMLRRKLIYTAVTRAKKALIMLGNVKAIQQGILKIENNRKTILKEKLMDYLKNNVEKIETNDFKSILDDIDDSLGENFSELKPSDFEL